MIWGNPITKEIKKALRKDLALCLIFYRDGTAVIKALKRDGSYLTDEKGNKMWEVKKMTILRNVEGQMVRIEGADKPALLLVGKHRIPIYVLHEDNPLAPSNPSMVLIDPDAFISGISSRNLFQIAQYAELAGMLRERSKLRDAVYYALMLIGGGIAGYMIITALSYAVK